MALFRMVQLEEGMPVQFVGNYVLRANEPPKYGFIEVDERDEARRWAAAWKRAAKHRRQMDEDGLERCKQLEAQLTTAADNEADAIKGRQEAERELREARDVIGEVTLALTDAVDERDAALVSLSEARAEFASVADAESDSAMWAQQAERERDEARKRNEALEELVARIPNVVSYATATLASATDDPGTEWGQVHRGRAYSSTNQLKELARRAYWLLEEDGNE